MGPVDEDTKWKIEIFKDKLRHSLGARFLLRFHVSLILLFSIFSGWCVDLLLLKLGLMNMMVRYVLAICAAYGGFLVGVYIWIEYSGIRQFLNERKAEELVGDKVPRQAADWKERVPSPEWLDPSGCLMGGEGCVTVVAVLFALVIVFYFLGGYVVMNAASFFAEIVLEMLLAAGLLRGIKRVETSGWMLSAMNATWWSFCFSLVVAVLFSWVAMTSFPTAKTLPEVIKQWHR